MKYTFLNTTYIGEHLLLFFLMYDNNYGTNVKVNGTGRQFRTALVM